MSAAPVDIVACGPPHGPVVATLQQRCFDEHWSAETVTGLLSQPGVAGLLVIAREGTVALGYALVRFAAGEGEILSLGVDPGHRRAGHGGCLVGEIVARAAALGAEALFLEVADSNVPARNLYETWGFQVIGRRRGYYRGAEGPEDAVTYRKTLDKS